jgi:hypothetical protein
VKARRVFEVRILLHFTDTFDAAPDLRPDLVPVSVEMLGQRKPLAYAECRSRQSA